jgi:uncharacterized protein (UPF0333 family)
MTQGFLEGIMYIKNKKGQSTVEYILLVTAVLAVLIIFLTSQNKGSLQYQLNTTLNTVVVGITDESDALAGSHPLANAEAPDTTTNPITVNPLPVGTSGSTKT